MPIQSRVFAAVLLAFLPCATAQQTTAADPDALQPRGLASALHDAVGANYDSQGVLWAGGPTVEALFRDGRVEITTPHAKAAERTLDLHYSFTAFGRRAGVMSAAGSGSEQLAGTTVTIARPAVDEVYEIRQDGLKQSFVFHRLPAGTGDLVVRGTVRTELTAGEVNDEGLVFAQEEVASVRFGQVLGFDARGRQTRGTMHWDGNVLEFALPAAFVDQAVLPLTLDPLIGSNFDVSTQRGSFDQEDPDIAFDVTTGNYLAVFERVVGTNDQIRAARFDAAGGSVTSFLAITSSATASVDPSVGNINVRDSFIVTWTENTNVWGASVGAAAGDPVSAAVQIANSTDIQINTDVGGESTLLDDDVVVVFDKATRDEIQALQVELRANGTFGFGNVITIGRPTGGTNPSTTAWGRISKSGGATGRYLVTWAQTFAGSGNTAVYGAIIDRNVGVLDALIPIAGTFRDNDFPDNDGDGTHWIVAYETEAFPGSGDNDIACWSVDWSPTALAQATLNEVIVEGDLNDNERSAKVCWLGGSALIGYADEVAGVVYDAYVFSVNPFNCQPCEKLDERRLAVAVFGHAGFRLHRDGERVLRWRQRHGRHGDLGREQHDGSESGHNPRPTLRRRRRARRGPRRQLRQCGRSGRRVRARRPFRL